MVDSVDWNCGQGQFGASSLPAGLPLDSMVLPASY